MIGNSLVAYPTLSFPMSSGWTAQARKPRVAQRNLIRAVQLSLAIAPGVGQSTCLWKYGAGRAVQVSLAVSRLVQITPGLGPNNSGNKGPNRPSQSK